MSRTVIAICCLAGSFHWALPRIHGQAAPPPAQPGGSPQESAGEAGEGAAEPEDRPLSQNGSRPGQPAGEPLRSVTEAEGESAPAEAGREILREQTVYVPYEDIEKVFEKAGRGVFLPYEEFLRLWKEARNRPEPQKPAEPPAAAVIRAGRYQGAVEGELARFEVRYDVEALVEGWSSLEVPLRGVAVESAELSNEQAVLTKDDTGYRLLLPGKGRYEVALVFSVPVESEPGRKRIRFGIPPIAVSNLELAIPEEEVRVEVKPLVAAVRLERAEGLTRIRAFVGDAGDLTVEWTPPPGRTEEAAVYFAEQEARTYAGERIVRLGSTFRFRLVRGKASRFTVRLPENMRLLAVKGDNIRTWSQDGRKLEVELHSPVAPEYRLELQLERVLEETPPTIQLGIPHAEGVLRQSGWIALDHDPGLKLRVGSAVGLSQLDPEEVPQDLRKDAKIAFRFLAPPPPLELEVERIEPLVRSETVSVVMLGPEEDVWVGVIEYSIRKAGLFRFEIRIPERWSVDEVGIPGAVEDYRVAEGGGLRTVTVTLKNRALGAFRLPFRFTAPGSAGAEQVTLRPPHVVDSEEDRGVFAVTAPRSLELNTTAQNGLRSTDVQELYRRGVMGRVSEEAGTPLTYSYREHRLESPATLTVAVRQRKSEIRVLAQHRIEVTGDRIRYAHRLEYEILYREVETLRFKAPSALDEVLKIESREVKERRKVSSEGGETLWEVSLQAPMVGSVTISVSHEEPLSGLEPGKPRRVPVPLVRPAGAIDARRGYAAVVRLGTLEVDVESRGMEEVDPGRLPDELRRGKIHSALAYIEEAPELTLVLTRYEYEPLAKAVVHVLHMETVLSPDPRKLMTTAIFAVENHGLAFLELEFPENAQILRAAVSGVIRPPRKRADGRAELIELPQEEVASLIPVAVQYEVPLGSSMGAWGGVRIESPRIVERPGEGVAVHRISLNLYLPPGYTYLDFDGSLRPELAAGESPEASPAPKGVPGAFRLPTEGLEKRSFAALAPQARLEFSYMSPALFFLAQCVAFIAVFGLGYAIVRRAYAPAAVVVAALVLVPLAVAWFEEAPGSRIYAAGSAGGLLLALAVAVPKLQAAWRRRRERRRALSPDPYLEEAGGPATPAVPPPAPEEHKRERGAGGGEETPPERAPEDKGALVGEAQPGAPAEAEARPGTPAEAEPSGGGRRPKKRAGEAGEPGPKRTARKKRPRRKKPPQGGEP